MKRLAKHFTTPTARNSSIFYFGNLAINFGRYLFHLLLLRFLTPDSYGEFLSYVSLLYLLTIPSGVIQTIVSRNISFYFGKKDKRKINNFFYFTSLLTLIPALVISVIVLFSAHYLATLLKANSTAFTVLSIMTIISLFGAIVRSYLPALQMFVTQVVIGFVELFALIGSVYLFLQFEPNALGGVLAMLVSTVIAIILSLYSIRRYIAPKPKQIAPVQMGDILLYSFIFSAGSLSLMSTDILLVRYFLSTHESGLYSALSIIGRMILFGLLPIASLLLPLAASRHAQKQDTTSVYVKLIAAASILGGGAVMLFSLFPDLVVRLLSGHGYLSIVPLVPYISVSMLFLALNQLTLSYLLAVGKEKSTLVLLFFALLQPILIFIYHSSLYQIITLNLTIEICLFLSLLLYNKFIKHHETAKI